MQESNEDLLEMRLAKLPGGSPPPELRSRVLAGVHGELRAAKWERRLARAAVLLLVIGVGMNAGVVLRAVRQAGGSQVATDRSREALVDTAVAVAEATDPETGRQYARQLAAQIGRPLTHDQVSEIDEAIENRITRL